MEIIATCGCPSQLYKCSYRIVIKVFMSLIDRGMSKIWNEAHMRSSRDFAICGENNETYNDTGRVRSAQSASFQRAA